MSPPEGLQHNLSSFSPQNSTGPVLPMCLGTTGGQSADSETGPSLLLPVLLLQPHGHPHTQPLGQPVGLGARSQLELSGKM